MTYFTQISYRLRLIEAGKRRFAWALFALFTLFISVMPARAEIALMLGNGLELRFESGRFDTQSLDGEIDKMRLFEDNQLRATAAYLKLETSGTPDTADFVLDTLILRDLEVVGENGEELLVTEITAESLPIGLISGAVGNEGQLAGREWRNASLQVTNLLGLVPESGLATEIASISLGDIEILRLASGLELLRHMRLDIPTLRLMPLGNSEDAFEFETALAQLGRTDFNMGLVLEADMIEEAGILRQLSDFDLRVSSVGDIRMMVDIGMPTTLYEELLIQAALGQDDDMLVGELLANLTLHGAELSIADKGGLALIDQAENMPSRAEMAGQAALILNSFLPQNGPALSQSVAGFMQQGGRLSLSINPPMGFPFEAMVGFLFLPDMAIDQLQAELIHQP